MLVNHGVPSPRHKGHGWNHGKNSCGKQSTKTVAESPSDVEQNQLRQKYDQEIEPEQKVWIGADDFVGRERRPHQKPHGSSVCRPWVAKLIGSVGLQNIEYRSRKATADAIAYAPIRLYPQRAHPHLSHHQQKEGDGCKHVAQAGLHELAVAMATV